jgi:hypothetical protein
MRNGPPEGLLYVPCVVPDASRPDYLATVDADPASATFGQVCSVCLFLCVFGGMGVGSE